MPRCTSREERILTLTRDLFTEQASLPLDTIDGEFFWRICQEPVARTLEQYRELPEPEYAGCKMDPDYWYARLDHRREQQRLWMAFEREHWDLLAPVPAPFVGYLRRGERVPMRPPFIWQTNYHPHFPALRVLVVHVRSGEWTGNQVAAALVRERELDPFLADDQHKYEHLAARRLGLEASALHLTALLHRQAPAMDEETWPTESTTDAPCIEVVIQFPLPDAALVGQFYDTSVRATHGWHQVLPGGQANGQHKDVAIRTWAIGLLMATGLSHFQAVGEVMDVCDEEPVTQGRFNRARSELLKRVPEGRPYVFAAR